MPPSSSSDNLTNACGRSVLEFCKYATPLLLIVVAALCTLASGKLNEIDQKLFTHLTNHDLHTPREQLVSQAEFNTYKMITEDMRSQFLELRKEVLVAVRQRK